MAASDPLAWSVQAAGSLALAVALVWLWRSRAPFDLKAAALAAGTLIATPYVYMYDLVVRAVPSSFLSASRSNADFSQAKSSASAQPARSF